MNADRAALLRDPIVANLPGLLEPLKILVEEVVKKSFKAIRR